MNNNRIFQMHPLVLQQQREFHMLEMNKKRISLCSCTLMSELREAANVSKERFHKYFHNEAVNPMKKIEKPPK